MVYGLWVMIYGLWLMIYGSRRRVHSAGFHGAGFTVQDQGAGFTVQEVTFNDSGSVLSLEVAALLVDGSGHLHHHVLITES